MKSQKERARIMNHKTCNRTRTISLAAEPIKLIKRLQLNHYRTAQVHGLGARSWAMLKMVQKSPAQLQKRKELEA